MIAFLLLFSACEDEIVLDASTCEVQVLSYSPEPVVSGEEVVVVGFPFTDAWDTLLKINGTSTPVLDLSRSNCIDCDTCRVENQCAACQDCDICDSICKSIQGQSEGEINCFESLTFVMPNVSEQNAAMQLFNAYGHSDIVDINVEQDQQSED